LNRFSTMKMTKIMKTRSALVAGLLTFAVAVPVFSDTLILRSGEKHSGTLTAANVDTITFRDRSGGTHRYLVTDVQAIQFGDSAYDPRRGSGTYAPPPPPPPPNDRRDDRGYGDDQDSDRQNSGNYYPPPPASQDDHGYDQARMERVVLQEGTEVAVLTNERIDSRDSAPGQTFSAQISEDILDRDGSVAIPRGSDATLITRRLDTDGDITLDIESIVVGGRRYRVSTQDQELENRRDGVGANKRTGQYVGGGAIFGAIIGAIAGGGKGAAIGAVAGAGTGAGVQTITRGKEVRVAPETVIRFRLDRPLKLQLWS
jgi:hypothetical protein